MTAATEGEEADRPKEEAAKVHHGSHLGRKGEATLQGEEAVRVHLGSHPGPYTLKQGEETCKVDLGSPATGEYSFRLFPVGETQERAPFPLPAPFDKKQTGNNIKHQQVSDNQTSKQQIGSNIDQQQSVSEDLPSSAPALPPKRGRREN